MGAVFFIDHLPGVGNMVIPYSLPNQNGLLGWSKWRVRDGIDCRTAVKSGQIFSVMHAKVWQKTLTGGNGGIFHSLTAHTNKNHIFSLCVTCKKISPFPPFWCIALKIKDLSMGEFMGISLLKCPILAGFPHIFD